MDFKIEIERSVDIDMVPLAMLYSAFTENIRIPLSIKLNECREDITPFAIDGISSGLNDLRERIRTTMIDHAVSFDNKVSLYINSNYRNKKN